MGLTRACDNSHFAGEQIAGYRPGSGGLRGRRAVHLSRESDGVSFAHLDGAAVERTLAEVNVREEQGCEESRTRENVTVRVGRMDLTQVPVGEKTRFAVYLSVPKIPTSFSGNLRRAPPEHIRCARTRCGVPCGLRLSPAPDWCISFVESQNADAAGP